MTHRQRHPSPDIMTHGERILDPADVGFEQDFKGHRLATNTLEDPNTKGNPALPTFGGGLAYYGRHARGRVGNVEGNHLLNDRVDKR